MKYGSGHKYEGQWFQDQRHGIGLLSYPDSMFYEGFWASDATTGHGILFAPNRLPTIQKDNHELYGRSKHFKEVDKRFRHYTKMTIKFNDIV